MFLRAIVASLGCAGRLSVTIDVVRNAVFGKGQTVAFVDEAAFQLDGNSGRPDPTILNRGSVSVTSNLAGYDIIGVQNLYNVFYYDSYFLNAKGASLTVAAHGIQQNAFAFSALSWSAD